MYIVLLPIVSARSSAADIQDINIEGDSASSFASASESPVDQHSPSAGSGNSDAQATTANPSRSASPGLYSPTSDLGWEDYLEERLNTELRRAASFDQDLVLILLTLSGVYRNTEKYRSFADRVREFFTFRDLCFEFGQSGIGVIVPNIDLDQGIERYEDFRNAKSNENMASHLHAGISSRNGRLIDGKRLIREASGAVDRARSEKTGIVAFRVDPEKYRSYIASQA
jgi:GGDEF domain-containing protein